MAQFVFDSHTHSNFSPDAQSNLDQMCLSAIEKGIDGFCVTDHCDVNHFGPGDWSSEEQLRQGLAAINAAKQKYGKKLMLHCGLELAQQDDDPVLAQRIIDIFSEYHPDFLIGSMHRGAKADDFSMLDFDKVDFIPLLDAYYKQLLVTAQLNFLDVLAHITYPLRYAGKHLSKINLKNYDDITDEILKCLIQNGKGIELNCSGLRQAYGDTFPSLATVRRYRELGGEIITIGSDSHTNSDIAADFDKGFDILSQAGFRYYCYFKECKPVFVCIDR